MGGAILLLAGGAFLLWLRIDRATGGPEEL